MASNVSFVAPGKLQQRKKRIIGDGKFLIKQIFTCKRKCNNKCSLPERVFGIFFVQVQVSACSRCGPLQPLAKNTAVCVHAKIFGVVALHPMVSSVGILQQRTKSCPNVRYLLAFFVQQKQKTSRLFGKQIQTQRVVNEFNIFPLYALSHILFL